MSSPPPIRTALQDVRNVRNATIISDIGGYYDGQSIVCAEGEDLVSMVFHHSHNHEGGPGLRLYHSTSTPPYVIWSKPQPVENSLTHPSHDGYQFTHKSLGKRVYCIYGYNEGQLQYSDPETGDFFDLPRGDMQLEDGFCMKYSDDGGRTYESKRIYIPVRRTEIDRKNPWGGATMGAFHCDKPSIIGESVYFAFQKTPEGGGETHNSEVFFMRSKDLLKNSANPSAATWETLPLGDKGLQYTKNSKMNLGEEPHIFQVSNENPLELMCVFRTELGVIACAFSSDGGESFSPVTEMTYDGSRPIKNPRGSLTPHRFSNGNVLLTTYNNSHLEMDGYTGRRYYWYIVGRPVSGHPNKMIWSEAELGLYWDGESLSDRPGWNVDWAIVDGPGYPDFCELPNGELAFVESNKLTLRLHYVDPRTLYMLQHQHLLNRLVRENLQVHLKSPNKQTYRGFNFCDISSRSGGFTIVVHLRTDPENVKPKQYVVDARETVTSALDEECNGTFITKGFSISLEGRGKAGLQLCLSLSDGKNHVKHFSDGLKWDKEFHVVSFVVDAGPRIITTVVDTQLCDGGRHFPEGWTTLDRSFESPGGANYSFFPEPTVPRPHSGPFQGKIRDFMVYDRPLLTGECISNARSLLGETESKL